VSATVYLIRHAKARPRSDWTDEDALRPLTAKGHGQADAIGRQLAPAGIGRVVTSPAVRCRQTVAPLAERLSLPVEDADQLCEGRPVAPALELLDAIRGDAAVSAHGDLIPELLERLAALGMRLDGPPRAQKGSVWCLERAQGRFVTGRYSPPP
jgi:8-oxo-dGTP diphosphatase